MAGRRDYRPEDSAVFCVDGITAGVVKRFTPDISWGDYVRWLKARRPELSVVHLAQPYDWLELITGRADPLTRLQQQMLEQAEAQLSQSPRFVVVLGFSLGGLTALQLTLQVARRTPQALPNYLAFVTFGTPFKGTGRLQDMLIRHLPQDYFRAMFDVARTRTCLGELLEFGLTAQLRLLIGEIAADEMVSASSSLLPVHWLTARPLPEGLRWGTFEIEPGTALRAHDGLLHDPQAIGYIDGLVDGLLPPAGPAVAYEPFSQHQ